MPKSNEKPETVELVTADGTKVTAEAHLQEKLEGRGYTLRTVKAAPVKESK